MLPKCCQAQIEAGIVIFTFGENAFQVGMPAMKS